MKLLLISDIHFGVKKNDATVLKNTEQYIKNDVCNIIEKESIDVMCVLGDLFDDRFELDVLVLNTVRNLLLYIVDRFPKLKLKLLVGNHDAYYAHTNLVNSLNKFSGLHENIEVISEIKKYNFDGCRTVMVPWLIDGSKDEKIFKKIVDHYNEHKKYSFDLCLGHFSINGFEVIKGVVEEKGIKQEDFNAFKSVFSGHFHIRNKIGNIQYLGCPYEITWNDAGDEKGVTVFDTHDHSVVFYKNTVSPRHVIIKASEIENIQDIDAVVKDNKVRLIIDKKVENIEKIEEKIESKCKEFTSIDETAIIIDGDEVELKEELLSATPVAMLVNFCDENEFPEDLDKNEYKMFLNELYEKTVKESE